MFRLKSSFPSAALLVAIAATSLFPAAAHATTYSIVTISTRPGITVPLMITDKSADTPPPVATLILFTGGDGRLNLLTEPWPTA